jgi:NADH dehydrogenase
MILVTGGAGYVGSHIVKRLVEGGRQVRVLARSRNRVDREGRLNGLEVDIVEGDVTQPQSLAPALDGVESVIHTVAIAIEKGNNTYEKINFQGTANLVDAVQQSDISRFINLSQLGADPAIPYRFLASKGRAQAYVANSKLEWTALRPSVVWGPEDEFANTFARLAPLTPIIFPIVGGEKAKFEPIWVEDLVSVVVTTLVDPATVGKEFELGGPEVLTLEEIERRTLKAINAKRIFIRFPMPLLRLIVIMMERLLPAPPVTRSLLELLAVSNVTEDNALSQFVTDPRKFTPENISPYMKEFRVGETISRFLGR